jgi:hypothetical protein
VCSKQLRTIDNVASEKLLSYSSIRAIKNNGKSLFEMGRKLGQKVSKIQLLLQAVGE